MHILCNSPVKGDEWKWHKRMFLAQKFGFVIFWTHFMSAVEGWRGLRARCRVKETRKTEETQSERYWGSTASTASFFDLLNPPSQPPNFIILQNIFVDKSRFIKKDLNNFCSTQKSGWNYQKKCYDGKGGFNVWQVKANTNYFKTKHLDYVHFSTAVSSQKNNRCFFFNISFCRELWMILNRHR